MKQGDRGSAETFLDGLCMFRELVVILFSVSSVLLLLSLGSYAVVEPGTATYVVVVLNLIGLSGFVLVSGGVLLLCRNRS